MFVCRGDNRCQMKLANTSVEPETSASAGKYLNVQFDVENRRTPQAMDLWLKMIIGAICLPEVNR